MLAIFACCHYYDAIITLLRLRQRRHTLFSLRCHFAIRRYFLSDARMMPCFRFDFMLRHGARRHLLCRHYFVIILMHYIFH